jgi:hypothetical protein
MVLMSEKFKVGDYASYIWGYGQTNVDWFKVVRRSDKSVWLEGVKGVQTYDGDMHGSSVPSDEPEFLHDGVEQVDGEWRNKLKPWNVRKVIRVNPDGSELARGDYGNIRPWDGEPRFFSEWN